MAKVTAELLRKARAGDGDALFDLVDIIQDPTKYKVLHLEISLAHLQVNRLPGAFTNTNKRTPRALAALPALVCVALAAGACTSRPEVKTDTVAKVLEGLDGIIGWINAIMQHWVILYKRGEKGISVIEDLFRQITQPLCVLIPLDNRLAVAIFSSQTVLTTIHQIWSINLETHPARTDLMDENLCAVIRLVEVFALHSSKEGKFHLLHALASSPQFLSSFCEGISWRFRNTITYHQHNKSNISTAARLSDLATIAYSLFMETSNPAFSAALRQSGTFTSWITTLLELREILPPPDLQFQLRSAILLATSRYGRPTHSISDIIEAGVIPLLLSMLSNLDWGEHEDILDALRMVEHVSRLALFPRTGRCLYLAFNPEYKFPSILNEGVASGIMDLIWSYLWQGTALMNRILLDPLVGVKEVVICDNRLHHQRKAISRRNSFKRLQCCSGCHLVTYCSQVCQREDWEGRHKSECESMKQTFDKRRSEAAHYSQTNRHIHVQMVMELFRGENLNTIQDRDTTSPNKIALLIDLSPGLDRPTMTKADPLVDFPDMFFGTFDSPEMEARKDEIIKDCVAQPFSTTKRLLALVLFLDIHRRVHLLVETLRNPSDPDEGSSFVVTQSVVSIEDASSSGFRYESRYEAAMRRFLNGEKGGRAGES
ncbi:hypothetical protein BKA70DRAFT_1405543 [Coprinopsis sp. MPI-PUGE-AT-0042]|nr:hypothetical protein BKA70DRAFT_1405543 [Coprinopsis sp. MPI-PUGE-AT-0042]